MKLRILAVVSMALTAGSAMAGEAAFASLTSSPHASTMTAKDLKTIHYVENAHGQLDEWAQRLVARLERGLGPRQSDPMLDGRAFFQVLKLRITYAGYAHDAALAEVIELLADKHEARLAHLETMLRYGVDRERFAATSDEIGSVMHTIRNWRGRQ